jgi:hypothetical protein
LFLEISASNEELCSVPRKPIPPVLSFSSSMAFRSVWSLLFSHHFLSSSITAM